eukprot:CAMPEP_0174854258 /NCGR_PEP_ID=MMETSP1114-20130205/30582_1 /TAXON_ID=312471 /ORGANISM="Neobodo designis, Strain CCAP 1951/1" /LENGTH=326 /DNA_ID=CAMNT_0016088943 /DNA_START=43 /DNA_END=1023 /DNA_ORIENTATION=+
MAGTTNSAPIALQYDYAPMAGSLERMRPREHAIVLVHGMTSAAATFGNVLHDLTAVAHVFAVDLRGHGRTADPTVSENDGGAEFLDAFVIPTMARDVAHFIRTVVFVEKGVASDVGSVHVLGHSWGARVVSALAMDPASTDLVKSLVIEDEVMTALDLPEEQKTKELAIAKLQRAKGMWQPVFPSKDAAVKFCADAMQGDVANYERKVIPEDPTKPDGAYKVLFKPHVAVAWNFHATTFDCVPVWDGSAFPRPVAIVSADDDTSDIVIAKQTKSLLEEATTARDQRKLDRRFTVIAGSSHSVHRTHSHEFVHAVRDFVAAVVHNID